ncbi:UNVERIFIED_CONTAM: hypothetical protein Sangu_2746000, partial [Sesamum angustifolium]
MLREIAKRLQKLEIREIAPIIESDKISDKEEENSDKEVEEIQHLEEMFKKELYKPFEINKINFGNNNNRKPYYHRPTPVDLLIEEQENYLAGASFDGTSIHEWNIDGHTEYQIQTKLHYITMYATACRLKGNNDPDIAKAIIQGFTGQLK